MAAELIVRAMEERVCTCNKCGASFPEGADTGHKFNFCPLCARVLPDTVKYMENYFRIIQLVEPLHNAQHLLLNEQSVAAVRDAVVTLERIVRKRSGLQDLMGADLMAKAFRFDFDSSTGTLTKPPKIQVNSLSNVTERNEQEGLKFIAMGLMQGIRNIYMHTEGTRKIYYCLQIITTTDFVLKQVLGWESVAES